MAKKKNSNKTARPIELPIPLEILESATGSTNTLIHQHLVNQVVETLWLPSGLGEDEKITRIDTAITILQEIKPQDSLEGLLAIQMVATHNTAIDCLRRAMITGQSFEGRELNLKHAAKFLSIYSRQLEALGKHRGKGQQKVIVEYVNVESGGQAIVGNVQTGERKTAEEDKKPSPPQAVTHDPGETIDMAASSFERKKSKVRKKTR